MNPKNIGSTFDSWLHEEDIYQETTSKVITRVLARQVEAVIPEQKAFKQSVPSAPSRKRRLL